MYKHEQRILETLNRRLRESFLERIQGVYAFGSRVRGDHHQWSDFDVLVVVKDRNPAIEREIITIFVEEELKHGVTFSPVIKDSTAFDKEKKLHTPFYENIQREGVAF
jgi:predicted nucleotidyltransferase